MKNKPEHEQFFIRCSAISKIMGGSIGLSDAQKNILDELISREKGTHPKNLKLTPLMHETLAELRHKQANPELPQGAKTYCKQWVKEFRYNRRKELKNRYVKKGNYTEEEGFTLFCIELNLGVVEGCTIRKKNDYSNGICDLDLEKNDEIFDNKSSWDLDTFPLFEDELPNSEYYHQGQGYMELYNRSKCSIVYTLIDCPIELLVKEFPYNSTPNEKQEVAYRLIYTREYWDKIKESFFPEADDIEFIEIPSSERVKRFQFDRDKQHAIELKKRVEMCRGYIKTLTTKK